LLDTTYPTPENAPPLRVGQAEHFRVVGQPQKLNIFAAFGYCAFQQRLITAQDVAPVTLGGAKKPRNSVSRCVATDMQVLKEKWSSSVKSTTMIPHRSAPEEVLFDGVAAKSYEAVETAQGFALLVRAEVACGVRTGVVRKILCSKALSATHTYALVGRLRMDLFLG